jgi:putative ABC transport system substrate-binding protein
VISIYPSMHATQIPPLPPQMCISARSQSSNLWQMQVMTLGIALLQHFPLDLVSSLRYKTSLSGSPLGAHMSIVEDSTMRLNALGLLVLLTCGLLAAPCAAEAQQAKHVPQIGFLSASSPSTNAARIEAFRQGLRELGYVEGTNPVIEWRSAEGKLERLPALAAELVRLKVDVIVTAAPSSTRAAKEATATIPIVMGGIGGDPVAAGFVASLARPGGNVTGLTALAQELSGKQLELLKELLPRLSQVAVLGTSTLPGHAQVFKEMERAAGALKVQLQYLDVRGPQDIETAFREARKGHADTVLVLASPVLESHRTQVADLAAQHRLPTIYPFPEFVEAGGLVSYGVSIADLYHRAATYVDKILKGTKPTDLPVEQPVKFELIINLKTAKALSLTIPPTLLFQADEVIR